MATQVLPEQPEGIQLWALLFPKNGLRKAVGIAQYLVFYLPEFRDGTTDGHKKASSWNRKVALQSIKPELNAPLTDKQRKFRHAKNATKSVFNSNISLASEIAFLVASYVHASDERLLGEISSVLKGIDDDLNYWPLPENNG